VSKWEQSGVFLFQRLKSTTLASIQSSNRTSNTLFQIIAVSGENFDRMSLPKRPSGPEGLGTDLEALDDISVTGNAM